MKFKITPNVYLRRDKNGRIRQISHLQEPYILDKSEDKLATHSPSKLSNKYISEIASIIDLSEKNIGNLNSPPLKTLNLKLRNELRFVNQKQILKMFGLLLFVFTLIGCPNTKTKTESETDVKFYAVNYSECPDDSLSMAITETFCIHEVVSLTPFHGDCSKYKVGDRVCMNCPDGVCPSTTRYYTDDGIVLRACIVETRVVDRTCKEIWPRGTCKFYVTLVKI